MLKIGVYIPYAKKNGQGGLWVDVAQAGLQLPQGLRGSLPLHAGVATQGQPDDCQLAHRPLLNVT